jgi:hypothetical protein
MNLVWLAGMPRSGTTWVSQFFAASPHVRVKFCPLFSYAFKNAMSAEDDAQAWRAFFRTVYATADDYMDQLYLSSKGLIPLVGEKDPAPASLLIKSNRYHHLTEPLLQTLPEIRFIALVRDPVAAIFSWLTNPLEFPAGASPQAEWRSGACRKSAESEFWGFDDWKKVTSMHVRLAQFYPDRFFLHRYDDVARDPVQAARTMFSQVEIEFTPHVKAFIDDSRSRHDPHPRSVYKSKGGARWRDALDPQIVEAIHDDLAGTDLRQFLTDEKA